MKCCLSVRAVKKFSGTEKTDLVQIDLDGLVQIFKDLFRFRFRVGSRICVPGSELIRAR